MFMRLQHYLVCTITTPEEYHPRIKHKNMHFILPSHPSLHRIDRFDLLSSELPEVRFWGILNTIIRPLATSPSDLIDHLETIALTLHGVSTIADYGFLQTFLTHKLPSADRDRFFRVIWPAAVSLAAEMPELFPEGVVQCLSGEEGNENERVVLSRRQVACLVVHMFLGSLGGGERSWAGKGHEEEVSEVDFRVWFAREQRCAGAVEAYLFALVEYFGRFVDDGGVEAAFLNCSVEEWPVVFMLRELGEGAVTGMDKLYERKFSPLTVVRIPEASTDPSVLGLPRGASVISANKNVGFGPSGTQEETHVGSSPDACVAVLITPTLKDGQVLIVQGTEAMITVKGYGREARLDKVLKPDYNHDSIAKSIWPRRTMLVMDALELDMFDPTYLLPDLLPGHVDREIRKAYTAFSSIPLQNHPYTGIFTGLWGCRSFGGDPQIKAIIQWCAASMSGVPLHFVCAEDKQPLFATQLEAFSHVVLEHRWVVGDVMKVILALDASNSDARNTFREIISVVGPSI
jgi:poly(ADP-ribose) glycohydrolase